MSSDKETTKEKKKKKTSSSTTDGDKKEKKSKKDKKPTIMSVYNDNELAETAKAGVIEIAVALFDFDARSDAELSFKKEQYIEILKKTDTVGWWKGRLRGTSNSGLFPSNYAKVIYAITEKDAVRTAAGSIKMTPEQQKSFLAAAAQKKKPGEDSDSDSGGDKVTIATVLFEFKSRKPEEISISKGEEITVIEGGARGGWWKGQKSTGEIGLFPSNYCQISEREASGADSAKSKTIDNLRSKLTQVETEFKDKADETAAPATAPMSDNVGTLQQELRSARETIKSKDKEIRILNEKLRIAEEIIENMDQMLKTGSSDKKKGEKSKYAKRSSTKF